MSTAAATLTGFLFCAVSAGAGQAAIGGWVAPGVWSGAGLAENLGHTFTGLTAALGYALWRWGRTKPVAKQTKAGRWRDRLLQAVAASTPALFGCLYYGMAGQAAELHSRTFAALPPLAYLLAVVAGRRAAKE